MKKAIYTLLINWYQAADQSVPQWLSRAAEADATLASELSQGDALTRSLQKRPAQQIPRPTSDLTARVMRRITEGDYAADQSATIVSQRGGFLRAAGLVAGACALVLVSFQAWNLSQDSEIASSEGENSHPSSVATVEEPEADGGVKLDLNVLETDWKNPLDQEIKYVITDAKGALNFLKESFVPSGLLKKDRSDQSA